jgi:hypothetical protein
MPVDRRRRREDDSAGIARIASCRIATMASMSMAA